MSRSGPETAPVNGVLNEPAFTALEVQLRGLFGEQQRLRTLLDQAEAGLLSATGVPQKDLSEVAARTRADLDRINASLRRFQDDYCTNWKREQEYDRAIERILGFDPRIDFNEVEEILAGKRSCEMGQFILGLESTKAAAP